MLILTGLWRTGGRKKERADRKRERERERDRLTEMVLDVFTSSLNILGERVRFPLFTSSARKQGRVWEAGFGGSKLFGFMNSPNWNNTIQCDRDTMESPRMQRKGILLVTSLDDANNWPAQVVRCNEMGNC